MSDPLLSTSTAVAITPSDSVDLPNGPTGLGVYVGVAGDVTAIVGGNTVTYKAAVGRLNIRASRILATGTTATNLIAEY